MSNTEDFSNRVRTYREREGLSQEELAKLLGISRNYVSMIEGGREPSGQVMRHFELLELAPVGTSNHDSDDHRQIVAEKSSTYRSGPNPLRRVPLISLEDATEAENLIHVIDPETWQHFTYADIRDPKAIAVPIKGDSMLPVYKDGDLAVLACSTQPVSDNLIVGRLKTEGIVFKLFQIIDPESRLYRLVSFNEHHAPLERSAADFIWIYPVYAVVKTNLM